LACIAVLVLIFLVVDSTEHPLPDPSPLDKIILPHGFKISVFATLDDARMLTISDAGIVYSSTRSGRIIALIDEDKDYQIDKEVVVRDEFYGISGLGYFNNSLFAVLPYQIVKFNDIDFLVLNNLTSSNTTYEVVFSPFPLSPQDHAEKYAKFHPDGSGKLFVAIGYPSYEGTPTSNLTWEGPTEYTQEWDKLFGKIVFFDPPYTNYSVYAHGVRNCVGFDWDPLTGDFWFTDNTHNGLGEDIPGEEVNKAPVPGLHFGYPYCHGCCTNEPILAPGWKCPNGTVTPAVTTFAHIAPLNMLFYRGNMFPSKYRQGFFFVTHGPYPILVAEQPTKGSNIIFVNLDPKYREPIDSDIFASGWVGQDYDSRWGRPVGLLELPDGSLLVSDDFFGAIYRITWKL